MKRLGFLCLLLNTSILAMPVVNQNQTYYQISGVSAQELRSQMNALGPIIDGKHYDAKTSWYVHWNYYWHYDSPSQNPCYVTSIKTSVDITTILPVWGNKSSADSFLQSKWETYLVNLRNHEMGHANNGKQAAIEIENTLLKTPPKSSCRELKAALESSAKQIIQQHGDWDVQYDKDTHHGKDQGAKFP